MLKKEIIYLYILDKYFKDKTAKFTQKGIAEALGFSLSTVNNAIKPLGKMHAVEVQNRCFILRDAEKALIVRGNAARILGL